MSFAPLMLTLARRESFTVEAELQEELNEVQEKLRAIEQQLTRALHQTVSMCMILVFASWCLYVYLI